MVSSVAAGNAGSSAYGFLNFTVNAAVHDVAVARSCKVSYCAVDAVDVAVGYGGSDVGSKVTMCDSI